MNSFRLINTVVVTSEMDFTKAMKESVYRGIVTLSTSTKTPKDTERNRNVYCSVTLALGEENDCVRIRMETFSKFEIVELNNLDTLRKDSVSYCSRQAAEDAIKKLNLLTEVHLGEPLRIPLPPDME